MAGPLNEEVYCDGRYRPFGELTVDQVAAHGAELGEAAGLGHGSRVGGVSISWKELARTMSDREAATVADLDAETVETFAERLWVVPPGGSLL